MRARDVANELQELKLGKGVAFVKSQLRRLRQEDDVWEADFLPIPCSDAECLDEWIGIVIGRSDDSVFAVLIVGAPPTVNDLADLLGHAMRRPLIEFSHRPRIIYLRAKPEWIELLPHLKEVGIEVVAQNELPKWDEAFEEFAQMSRRGPMASKGRSMVRQPATKSPKMQKRMVKNKIAAGLRKNK